MLSDHVVQRLIEYYDLKDELPISLVHLVCNTYEYGDKPGNFYSPVFFSLINSNLLDLIQPEQLFYFVTNFDELWQQYKPNALLPFCDQVVDVYKAWYIAKGEI